MLIAMVSIFVCCWLPLNVIILTSEYFDHLYDSPYFLLTFFGAHVVAMSSTVYNPFLYGWLNDNFQKEFRILLPCVFNVFNRSGGGVKRPGIETTMIGSPATAAVQLQTTSTEAIRLHQLRSGRNGCRNEEQKILVEATMDNIHHQHDSEDSDNDD